MKDDNKTREQLLQELAELRLQNTSPEKSESADKYRSLVENLRDVVYELDSQGVVLYISPGIRDLLGFESDEIIGKKFLDLAHKDDLSGLTEWFSDLCKGKESPSEYRVLDKSGGHKWAQTRVRPIMEDGQFKGARGILIDVTEPRKLAEALRESEEKYRLTFENVVDAIYMIDANLVVLSVSPSVEKILGYKPQDFIGRPASDLSRIFTAESFEQAIADIGLILKGETISAALYRFIAKDGTVKYGEVSGSPVIRDGKIVGVIAVARDITERKQAEEALRESEEKYRWVLNNIADVITVMDMNLRFTYVSPSILHMRGYTVEEATAQTLEQAMTPESLQISAKVFEEEMALEAGGTADPDRIRIVEVEQYRKDGTIVLMENHLSFMRDEAKKPVGILSVSHDVTERKLAEKRLQDTLESLRKAVGATIQVMVTAVEARDPYTSGHQTRTADLACAIATEMGLSFENIEGIRMAGSIHDIGKLSIPAEILSKPTKLSEIEFSLIKEHSRKGYEMLKDVESPWPLAEIVLQHHERMDGSGYPRKLKGKEILIEARILNVADVVEAMASHRPYRPSLGIQAALDEIEKNRGTIYDKTVADACLRLFREKGFALKEGRSTPAKAGE